MYQCICVNNNVCTLIALSCEFLFGCCANIAKVYLTLLS